MATDDQSDTDFVTMPDGSRLQIGRVMAPDGSEAAAIERKIIIARTLGDLPSYRDLTSQADAQRAAFAPSPQSSGAQTPTSPEDNALRYGRTVVLFPSIADGSISDKVSALWTPVESRDGPWTLHIQPPSLPALFEGINVFPEIVATVQFMIGACPFTKVFNVKCAGVTLRVPFMARNFTVNIQVQNLGAIPPNGIPVNVGIARGWCQTSIEQFTPRWLLQSFVASTLIATGLPTPRVLLSAICHMKSAPVAPVYPMFLDAIAGGTPVSMNNFVPFLVGAPLKAAGDYFSFSDEFSSDFFVSENLYFALSTVPEHFTAPAAGLDFTLNLKTGN